MADASKQEIKLFYCYAREDKALRDELEKHLSALKRQYQLTNWHDREILPGENWEQVIDTHLSTAHLILLLISPDFMASDYCYGREMAKALEREKAGTCRVIPILIRPTDWEDAPFSHLQLLPPDARPVTTWTDRDSAFWEIAKAIRKAIKARLLSRKSKNEPAYANKIEDDILRVVPQLEAKRQSPTIRDLSRYLKGREVSQLKTGVDDLVRAGLLSENKSGKSPRYTTIKDAQTSLKTKEKWLEKGEALHGLKRYEEALAAFEQAIHLDSSYVDAYNGKGWALYRLKRYEEALATFEQTIRLDPICVDAYDGKGNTLQKLGKTEEAEKAFEKARQLGYTN